MLYTLILTVILGDPETGPIHTFVLAEGLAYEACEADRMDAAHIWLGNPNIGMSCER